MSKLQIAVLSAALGLFLLLYFTCETKPPSQKAIEKSRAFTIERTDVSSLLEEAKSRLSTQGMADILTLEGTLDEAERDTMLLSTAYKSISSKWYALGEPAIAGYYAEEVANLEETGQAWGIAGTTYVLCTQQGETEKERQFCADRAVKAFENAISLAPDELSHRINLALIFTDFPPSDNPMKGILMLRELDGQYPENPSVLYQLGRLAVQTGQWERAIERLDKVVEFTPENRNAWCLLAKANQETGNQDRASFCQIQCQRDN